PDDYLEQLGLARSEPAPPPRAPSKRKPSMPRMIPPGAPPDAVMTHEDSPEPAPIPVARQAPRKLPTLDPAFASRVGPLPSAPSGSGGVGADGRERVILIVDDEEDIRRMLQRVLTERSFKVVEASRGTEALQAVRDHTPDCVLLDAMLPEIHGFDICRRIKGSKKYGHTPIIMVSAIYRGWRFAEDLKQSYGVFEFLEKPFKISDVVAAVERAITGKSKDDEEEVLSTEANDCLQKGIDAYRGGELDIAIDHLTRGVGLDPSSFRLHYHLGLLYGRRDQLFDGIQELESAVDLSPRNFAALKNLAVLYQRAGFKLKAIEMWERALGSAPDEETRRGIKDHLMSLL
ncbi:MAG: response regulator, partial [Sandaracinaceae bacterium]|nr:response regulator [Sandaracinaceae bacterium]